MRFVRKDYVYFYEAGIVCYKSTPISIKKLPKQKDFDKNLLPERDPVLSSESDFYTTDEVPLTSISLVNHRPLNLINSFFLDNTKENKTDEDKPDNNRTKEYPSLLSWSKGTIKYLKPNNTNVTQDIKNEVIEKNNDKISEKVNLFKGQDNINRNINKLDEQEYYIYNSLQKTTEKRTIDLLINRSYLNRRRIKRDIFDLDNKHTHETYQKIPLNDINEDEVYQSEQLEKEETITDPIIEKEESDTIQNDTEDISLEEEVSKTISLFSDKISLSNEEIRTVIDSPNVIRSLESFNSELSRLSTNKTYLESPEIFTQSILSLNTESNFDLQSEYQTNDEENFTIKLSKTYYQTSTESSIDSFCSDNYLKILYPSDISNAISDNSLDDSDDQFYYQLETEISNEESKFSEQIEINESIKQDPSVEEIITIPSSITQQQEEKISENDDLIFTEEDNSSQNYIEEEEYIDTISEHESIDQIELVKSETESIKTQQSQSTPKDVEIVSIHEVPSEEYRIIDEELDDNLYCLDTLFESFEEEPKIESQDEEKIESENKEDEIKEKPIESEVPKPEEEVIRPLKDIKNKILLNGFTATVYIVNSNKTATSSICKIMFNYDSDSLIIKSTDSMFEINAEGLLSEEIPTSPGSPILLKITVSGNQSSAIVVQSEVAKHLEVLAGTIGWVNEKSRTENRDKESSDKMKIRKSLFTGLKRKEKKEKEEEPGPTEGRLTNEESHKFVVEKEVKPRKGLFSRFRNRRKGFNKN